METRSLARALLAISVVLVSGCSGQLYAGPKLPTERIAKLEIEFSYGRYVVYRIIKGKEEHRFLGPGPFELLPGDYEIWVKRNDICQIRTHLDAGAHYIIHHDSSPTGTPYEEKWWVWLEKGGQRIADCTF